MHAIQRISLFAGLWMISVASFADDTVTATTSALAVERSQANVREIIEKHLQTIDAIESRDGPYSAQLSQNLDALGDIYQRNQQYKKAIDAYKRALHLKRINDGLYAISQVPIVKKMIRSQKALKQWQQVTYGYGYLYWLSKRNFSDDSMAMVPVLLDVAKWNLQSYGNGVAEVPAANLINAQNVLQHVEAVLSKHYGDNSNKLLPVYHQQLITNYFIATFNIAQAPAEQNPMNADGDVSLKMATNRIGSLKQTSFARGKKLLQKTLKLHQQQAQPSMVAITDTQLMLADWHLLFGKRKTALAMYHQAFEQAKPYMHDIQVVKLFEKPVILPHFPQLDNNTRVNISTADLPKGIDFVHVSADITRFGRAKNVTVVESNPNDNQAFRSKVIRTLRGVTFRPKLEQGDAIFAKNTQVHMLSR